MVPPKRPVPNVVLISRAASKPLVVYHGSPDAAGTLAQVSAWFATLHRACTSAVLVEIQPRNFFALGKGGEAAAAKVWHVQLTFAIAVGNEVQFAGKGARFVGLKGVDITKTLLTCRYRRILFSEVLPPASTILMVKFPACIKGEATSGATAGYEAIFKVPRLSVSPLII
jgi:hypothetical protein